MENKMLEILNIGSLNIDHVYQVPHFVLPGETLTSSSYARNAGGKGLNQSIALARASSLHDSIKVAHGGKIGADGSFLKELLAFEGVETSSVLTGDTPTGHAIIQVDTTGQNNIILYPGANRQLTRPELEEMQAACPKGSWILLQNEINEIPFIMEQAHARGLHIAINPAPCGPEVADYPIQLADVLFVNEIEAAQLALMPFDTAEEKLLDALVDRYPNTEIVLTLGANGALYRFKQERILTPAVQVKAVDTTSAGDTFIGYFLAARMNGASPATAMEHATKASAITVTRKGAAVSIPKANELA